MVIDGWGIAPEQESKGDAIRNAQAPVMAAFPSSVPYTTLQAHGLAVGLPDGLMGNSEVGHLNLGAGRVVYQVLIWILFLAVSTNIWFFNVKLKDIVRIDLSLKNDTLKDQPAFKAALTRAASGTGRLHLMGLVSDVP